MKNAKNETIYKNTCAWRSKNILWLDSPLVHRVHVFFSSLWNFSVICLDTDEHERIFLIFDRTPCMRMHVSKKQKKRDPLKSDECYSKVHLAIKLDASCFDTCEQHHSKCKLDAFHKLRRKSWHSLTTIAKAISNNVQIKYSKRIHMRKY